MSAQAPEFGQPILPVGDLPADGVARDGEEYLAMVRYVYKTMAPCRSNRN